jgi:hypothetical protein
VPTFPNFFYLLAAKAESLIVLNTLQQHCGWDAAQADREIAAYKQFMRDNCIPDFAVDRD